MWWQELLVEAGKGAAVGALIGYGTNRLAVWMLFHPKLPARILGIKVPLTPGLVVRNQDRLAEAVGRAVARDLLDPETIVNHLREANLSDSIEELLRAEYDTLADSGESLATYLGPGHEEPLEQLGERSADILLDSLGGMLRAPGTSPVDRPLGALLEVLADRPLAELLPEDVAPALALSIHEGLKDALRTPEFEAFISGRAAAATRRFAGSRAYRNFEDAGYDYIAGRLPAVTSAAQESLADFLASEEFGEQVQERLAGKLYALIVGKFPMAAMLFKERLLKELFAQHWDEIAVELQEIARGEIVTRVIESQFRTASGNIFESLREAIRDPRTGEALGGWAAKEFPGFLEKSPDAELLLRALETQLAALLAQTPRNLFRLPAPLPRHFREDLRRRLQPVFEDEANLAASRQALVDGFRRLTVEKSLHDVLSWIPREDWNRACAAIASLLEERSIGFLPRLLGEGLRLEHVVAAKIREFDSDRIEETIVRVSGRELKGIIRLGGVIGLLVGAAFQTAVYLLQ